MPKKSTTLIASLILLPLLLLLAACGGDDDEPAEYAEPRAYAGVWVRHETWQDMGEVIYLAGVVDGSPAAQAGVQDSDLLVSLDGVSIESDREYLTYLERRAIGDVVVYEVDRLKGQYPQDGSDPEFERLTISVELVEEPPPGPGGGWRPYADLDIEDQLRLGLFLGEITRPVADYYGLQGPEGVLIAMIGPSHEILQAKELEAGDVILRLNGHRVNTLAQVQSVLNDLDEHEQITVRVRRQGQDATHTLSPLGPSVPGANMLPYDARVRLHRAIEAGGLHPVYASHMPLNYRSRPDTASVLAGTITAMAGMNVTLELFSTGDSRTIEVTGETYFAALSRPLRFEDFEVGDFVEAITFDGTRANNLISRKYPPP